MLSKDEIKEIKAWCTSRKLKHTINDDGTVDIEGDVNIKKAKDGKFPIRFGKVTGNFFCECNAGSKLTTLEGGPTSVTGDYSCSSNDLTSLQGAPSSVGGGFYCGDNKLTSLEGGPTSVTGDYSCRSNELTSLQGAPSYVGGGFDCCYNKLTSLEGAPSSVGGRFRCYYNQLTSLEGAPSSVGGGFECGDNQLTSLEGAPSSVDEVFDCSCNKLTSLEGAPTSVTGNYYCGKNELTSLQGAPYSVGGSFECWVNQLTSLEGAPSSVGGSFECWDNKLTSLEGAPSSVGGKFDCSHNQLTNLRGIENTTIGGHMRIDDAIVDYSIAPIEVKEISQDRKKLILIDKMNLEQGYYVIAPQVRTLGVLNKNSVTKEGATETIALFHLPIRVDILGSVPPDIEVIEPSSISNLELHVPMGEVEVYSKHKQWKRAFLITDDNGTIVFSNPKNAVLYENYIAQKTKEEEEKKQQEIEEQHRQVESAKAERLKQMQYSSHEALCMQLLAAYKPKIQWYADELRISVTLKCGKELVFEMENSCPFTVWQNLGSYLEKLDNLFLDVQPLNCEVEMTMTLS